MVCPQYLNDLPSSACPSGKFELTSRAPRSLRRRCGLYWLAYRRISKQRNSFARQHVLAIRPIRCVEHGITLDVLTFQLRGPGIAPVSMRPWKLGCDCNRICSAFTMLPHRRSSKTYNQRCYELLPQL